MIDVNNMNHLHPLGTHNIKSCKNTGLKKTLHLFNGTYCIVNTTILQVIIAIKAMRLVICLASPYHRATPPCAKWNKQYAKQIPLLLKENLIPYTEWKGNHAVQQKKNYETGKSYWWGVCNFTLLDIPCKSICILNVRGHRTLFVIRTGWYHEQYFM